LQQAAELFLHLVESTTPFGRVRFVSARPWLSCCLGSSKASIAAFAASALITRSLEGAVTRARLQNATGERLPASGPNETQEQEGDIDWRGGEWEEMRGSLLGLFSRNPMVRAESAAAVRDSLKEEGPMPLEIFLGELSAQDSGEVIDDPFYELLLESQPLLSASSGGADSSAHSRELPTVKKQDAEKLLAIVRSSHVEDAIRRSALEQLRTAAEDRRLEMLLAEDEQLLQLLVSETIDWSRAWGLPIDSLEMAERDAGGEERGFGDLGLSALALLARLSSTSAARRWLLADSTARIHLLLPLIFHPRVEVRRELGALLTALLFSADELLTSLGPLGSAAKVSLLRGAGAGEAADDSEPRTSVPLPFLSQYSFPCSVIGAQVGEPLPEDDGKGKHQTVKRLLEQMRLLESGPVAAWQGVEKKMSAGGALSVVERQALAAIPNLLPERVFERALQEIREAQVRPKCI
jgi:hypothetical protein